MIIFAHRGASGYAPENTISSFKKAVEVGAKAVELDVQLTKDEEVVVIHDFSLNKTTDGKGYVKDHSLNELKKLDAGSWYGDDFTGEKIPTLGEVLDELPENVLVNVEIKNSSNESGKIVQKVFEILNDRGDRDIIISSFDHSALEKVREQDRDIKIGILFDGELPNVENSQIIKRLKPYSVHINEKFADGDKIEMLNSKKIYVYAYTVNEISKSEKLKNMGISGIFSDYPDIFK